MILLFLSSGLFLGWSLGANDAANVFGTAVGSKMVSFRRAAIIASIFVILGAVIQGAGAARTLGKLGSISAIAGAFTVALTAGVTVFLMTRQKVPVSTSQAIVGAIIGWNLYADVSTDYNTLGKIVSTWVLCPVLSAFFAIVLYVVIKKIINNSGVHLLRLDAYIRFSLVIVGAFGSYSLGANNIANVMGVFVSAISLPDINIGFAVLDGQQQLFFIGGIAIAVGITTYSRRVMDTVGSNLLQLSSVAAIVVVLAHSIVLFLFSSQWLHNIMISNGLPALPLVPVSSSQAIVGAVIGIGLLKGGKAIKFNVLSGIAVGWVTTPIIAGILTFVSLFFVDNVFQQQVYHPAKPAKIEITDSLYSHSSDWYYADFVMPVFSSSDISESEKLNKIIQQKYQSEWESFRQNQNEMCNIGLIRQNNPVSFFITYTVFDSEDTISLRVNLEIRWDDISGTEKLFTTYNYDLKNQKLINFESHFLNFFSDKEVAAKQIFNLIELELEKKETCREFNRQNINVLQTFNLTDSTIVFTFEPNVIGKYYCDYQEVSILKTSLQENSR